ncbi:F-box only protein 6-like [Denticeps clupeoides]|uniref:Uncharacterized protein n=1 Tax=Denticeps clupeoides TaxID=299321 RepID=A0AAY4E4D8_9TELE|nr:F-box only protein 6-like [Denticeps clupeoides]
MLGRGRKRAVLQRGPAAPRDKKARMGQSHSLAELSLGYSLELPEAVLEEIFLNIPAEKVVRVCRLVCHEWKVIADSVSLWKERCRRERLLPRDPAKVPEDWRLFYFLCKKKRNLIRNPKAERDLEKWELLQNGGDCWVVEGMFVPHPDEMVTKCFVTSYGKCLKCQLINLQEEGYSPVFMDTFQPAIKVSDWYAPRWDCGSRYELRVELLNGNKKVLTSFRPDEVVFEQWNDQQWHQVTHVFKDYGRGVRFIRFIHGGQDTQFWKGWYGIRVTNSSVEIGPEA